MVGYGDAPLLLRHEAQVGGDLSVRRDLLARLVASVNVGAGVGGIGQDGDHSRMPEATPDQFAIPGAAVCAARKAKTELVEAFDHGISCPFALEQLEDGANGALYFLIGIERNLVALIHITHGQWELELTLARLVELAAMEARSACAKVPFMPRMRLSLNSEGS